MSKKGFPPRPVADRFREKYVQREPHECWEWQAARQPNGYGLMRLNEPRRNGLAHRIAYELAYGPIPTGMVVMHACDNRRCVNPAHLSTGTYGDNNRDAKAKGRNASGERHGTKLRPESFAKDDKGRFVSLAKRAQEAA